MFPPSEKGIPVTTTTVSAPVKGARLALLVGGLVAVAFGIVVLAWPTKAAAALTGVIAVYAIIAGIVYIAIGLFAKALGAGGRIGHVILGILYVIAGVYAFSSLQQTAAFLALFLTIMVGVMWVIEGFTALFALSETGAKAFTVVYAIISILAGFTFLSSPIWGAVFLWWYLGIALIVLGILNVARAVTGKKSA